MTKKEYVRAAEIVRSATTARDSTVLREAFIEFFKSDNARFDEGRFRIASAFQAVTGQRQRKR